MTEPTRSTTEASSSAAGSPDPHVIDSIAVTVGDVVAALEANRSANRGAVLRITPPFAGRMRARLHVAGGEGVYDGDSEPIHIDPELLVERVPAYPTADDTADPSDDPAAHRRRHTDRLEAWRETVSQRLCEEVTITHDSEALDMRVLQLG